MIIIVCTTSNLYIKKILSLSTRLYYNIYLHCLQELPKKYINKAYLQVGPPLKKTNNSFII